MEKPIQRLPIVSIEPVATGFALCRAGKSLQTPAKQDFVVATSELAAVIAGEWQAQKTLRPDPATMPMTSIALTVIDLVAPNRAAVIDELMGYLESDLCCYRAQLPPALVTLQNQHWDLILDGIAARFGIRPPTTSELSPITLPIQLSSAIRVAIEQTSNDQLGVLQIMAGNLGSMFMALLLVGGAITVDQAMIAYYIEEDYFEGIAGAQEHGGDPMLAKSRVHRHHEIAAAQTYLQLSTLK